MRQGFALILRVLLPIIVIFGIFHYFSASDLINEIFPSYKVLQYKTQHVSRAYFSFSMFNFLAALSSLSFLFQSQVYLGYDPCFMM